MKIIAWWSAGVTSAVACKLALDIFGPDNVDLVYIHIGSAHPDNVRFKKDCEQWYGKKVETVKSRRYKDQFDVIETVRWVNGPNGARCTTELKKQVRFDIQNERNYEGQVFGFENTRKEINRALRFKDQYPETNPIFPLIAASLNKEQCFKILIDEGINLPVMYRLGYPNNNCIGCVKGGMGYWNKIRVDFPSVFDQMAELERDVGASCIKDVYLDELDPSRGRNLSVEIPDCGSLCDIKFADIPHPKLTESVSTYLTLYHNDTILPMTESEPLQGDPEWLFGEPDQRVGSLRIWNAGDDVRIVVSAGVLTTAP